MLKLNRKKKLSTKTRDTEEMDSHKEVMLEMSDSSIASDKAKEKKEKKKKSTDQLWPVYRQFFKYTLKRWKLALLCMFISMVSGFANSLFPLKLGDLLDVITEQTKYNAETSIFKQELKKAMILLATLTIIISILTFIRFSLLSNFQQRLGLDLKQEIYSVFIKNDIYFFQINQSSALVSRLTNDVNQAKSAISNNLTFLIRNFVTIVTSLIVLFIMNWKLTLILIAMIPIYVLVSHAYAQKAKKLVKSRQDIQADIAQHIGEKFSGITVIKAYGTEQKQIDKYNRETEKTYEVEKSRIFYQAIQMSVTSGLPSIGALLVLTYAGIKLLQGEPQLTAGELTSFVLYCNILSTSTMGVSSTYTNIINGVAAIQKVLEMMNYKRLINQDLGEAILLDGSVQFENVGFRYPNALQPLFDDLNLKIEKGEYVAFIGQSGSGKSTITKLLLSFYRIQSGNIYFNEDKSGDSKNVNIKSIRSQIGIVNQQSTLFTGTIEDNITYGLKDYTEQELQDASRRAGILQFVKNSQLFPLGFKTEVGERGNRLSGGQRQRIAIARALIRKPQFLIFDEATSALDSHNQSVVQRSIQSLAKHTQITIIVIAHRLSTVINCNRLFVMKQGQIVETGSHKDLVKEKGYYYELISKQLHNNNDQSQL